MLTMFKLDLIMSNKHVLTFRAMLKNNKTKIPIFSFLKEIRYVNWLSSRTNFQRILSHVLYLVKLNIWSAPCSFRVYRPFQNHTRTESRVLIAKVLTKRLTIRKKWSSGSSPHVWLWQSEKVVRLPQPSTLSWSKSFLLNKTFKIYF